MIPIVPPPDETRSTEAEREVYALIRALIAVRHVRGLTREDLAARVRVSESAVGAWEGGDSQPGVLELLAWAGALDCALRLVDGTGQVVIASVWHARTLYDSQESYRALAKGLLAARTEAELTQQDIANEIGVRHWAVSMWESADRIPRPTHLFAWAATLGCRLELRELDAIHTPVPLTDATREDASGRHQVTVPALPTMARTLREAASAFLAGHPHRDAARQIVSEFATEALINNRCTCCPHHPITLTVHRDQHSTRLELFYHLTLTHAPTWEEDEKAAYGHSLAIINAYTRIPGHGRWGTIARVNGRHHHADSHFGWWAELDDPRSPSSPFASGH